MLLLVNTYIHALNKAYDILASWEADEEEVTSLVILAKLICRDFHAPECDTVLHICDEIIEFSN
ncbi:MAG: hypothetical protein ABW185_20975 [Sedimenticola sp.]